VSCELELKLESAQVLLQLRRPSCEACLDVLRAARTGSGVVDS
jgi:hypothetical protein